MRPRTGAIAVIYREHQFLVIERSQMVTAPGMFCFPGGAVEAGEDESEAVIRELNEELGLLDSQPCRCLWRSENQRGTQLAWWLTTIGDNSVIAPDPKEVAAFDWWTIDRMRSERRLLQSNREFLDAMIRGEFELA